MENQSIVDFFDVNNVDHIKAYDTLEKTGMWPIGFISDDINFPNNWHILLTFKMTDAWIKLKLSENK
jgi:hypothetical protein